MIDNFKTNVQLIDELQQLRSEYKYYRENNPDAAMWQQVIDRSPFSIQMVDKEGFSISVNQAHTDFFMAIPPPDYNLFNDPQLLAQGLDIWFDKMKQGEAVFFPDTSYNPSKINSNFPDITIWLKTCGFPMLDADGKPMRFVVIHENITEHVKLEMELNELNVRLQSMASYNQYSVEKEKTQIAVELHDQIGQHLTGLKYDLDAIIIDMQEQEKVLKIKNIVNRINELINRVENLTSTIRPVTLHGGSMKSSVEWYLKNFEQQSGIKVNADIDFTIELPEEDALIIYRILQEAFINIGRHSKATQAEIIVKNLHNSFHLVISDNGIGITDEQIHSVKSFGLLIINERVKALNGSFSISSENNIGTRIEISIPLKQQKP
jgi:signal transduction histidine kinase